MWLLSSHGDSGSVQITESSSHSTKRSISKDSWKPIFPQPKNCENPRPARISAGNSNEWERESRSGKCCKGIPMHIPPSTTSAHAESVFSIRWKTNGNKSGSERARERNPSPSRCAPAGKAEASSKNHYSSWLGFQKRPTCVHLLFCGRQLGSCWKGGAAASSRRKPSQGDEGIITTDAAPNGPWKLLTLGLSRYYVSPCKQCLSSVCPGKKALSSRAELNKRRERERLRPQAQHLIFFHSSLCKRNE